MGKSIRRGRGCFCLDDKRYRFIETIMISVEKKEREHLTPGEDRRLLLAREYFNPDDQNSIRINCNFPGGETIGYIPKELARVLAPKMDAGTNYVGWVKNTDSKDNVIQVDIYERIIVPFSGIKQFSFTTWGYIAFGETFRYSATDGRFIYRKEYFRHDRYNSALEVSFCPPPEHWESFIQPALQACNFMAWEDVYPNDGIIDGLGWSMDIWAEGNRIRRMRGANNFPEEWDIFKRFMYACLEMYCGCCEFSKHNRHLSKKIQSCIKEYHISYSELAKQLNTTTQKIKKWETDSSELYGLSSWKPKGSKPEGLILMKLHEKIDYILYNALMTRLINGGARCAKRRERLT